MNFIFFALFILIFKVSLFSAPCQGKLDVAPTVLRIDVLEFGKTVRKLDVGGFRGAGDYFVWKNVMARGVVLVCRGDASFETYAGGLGACFPYKEFYFTPHGGYSYTNFRSNTVKIPQLNLFNLKERFSSHGPYVGLDAQWCFTKNWRLGGGITYAWANTKTLIKPLPKIKSSSKGPNYTLLLERDLGDQWSINVGAGYNRSLSREKHGLKGKGVKVGITRWY